MGYKYILNDLGEPEPCDDLRVWGQWMEKAERRISNDHITGADGKEILISTVFLGLDHSFGDDGPVLFETMIFGGPHDQYQQRYRTRKEAMAGHTIVLNLASGETVAS